MAQDHLFALPLGYEVAGYRFGEVLGSGGYGITYKAAEITLGRDVAPSVCVELFRNSLDHFGPRLHLNPPPEQRTPAGSGGDDR